MDCFLSKSNSFEYYLESKQYHNHTIVHCRFCAEVNESDKLLDISKQEILEEYKKIANFLKTDFLDLSNDEMPKTSCKACFDAYHSAYTFLVNVKKSQEILRNIYNIKAETEVTEMQMESNLIIDLIKVEPDIEVLLHDDIQESENEVTDTIFKLTDSKNTSDNTKKLKRKRNTTVKQNNNPRNKRMSNLRNSDSDNSDTSVVLGPPVTDRVYGGIPVFNNEDGTKKTLQIISDKNIKKQRCGIPEESPHSSKSYTVSTKFNDCNYSKLKMILTTRTPDSWLRYPWRCHHCDMRFGSMEEVRAHSKVQHNMCYGFHCADCNDEFNTFNAFVEHVRQHREGLRYFCQYCNQYFTDKVQCVAHTHTHWEGSHRICDMCGEICPDQHSLDVHKEIYRRPKLNPKYLRRKPKVVSEGVVYGSLYKKRIASWADYVWICLECCNEFPTVRALRGHSQDMHKKCFAIKCLDCLKVQKCYQMFVKHVIRHRPNLRNFCPYCNQRFEDDIAFNKHVNDHLSGPVKPCDGCGEIFESRNQRLQHTRKYDPPRPKSVLTEEDLTCEVCSRVCKTMTNLRNHRKSHETDRKRSYTCHTCDMAFFTRYSCEAHMRTHRAKKIICQICKMEFTLKSKLKTHALTHLNLKPYICDICGKCFRVKEQVKSHLVVHSNEKPFQCTVCGKSFRFKNGLKMHSFQHTGERKFPCEVCEKTFMNHSNCDKHMRRKHGISLSRTKLTAQGKLPIDRESGEPKAVASGQEAVEWLKEIIPELPGLAHTN